MLFSSDNVPVLSKDSATTHVQRSLRMQGPPQFLSHLSSTLAFALLIYSCYISILHLFLYQKGAREKREETCPLWVAKRLPFERSNPLHHISHNLLSFPITLWESISASSSSHPAPLLSISLPLAFTSLVSYCCLAAFNPTHPPAVLGKAFVFASTLCHLRKHANSNTNEKRHKTLIRYKRRLRVFENKLCLYRHTSIFCAFSWLPTMRHKHVTRTASGGSSSCLIWRRAGESSSSRSPPP